MADGIRKPGINAPLSPVQKPDISFIRYTGGFVLVETIQTHIEKKEEVESEGYRVKLTGRVFRGFKVDVIAPDGRELAKDLVVRKWFSKKVKDPHEEREIGIEVRDTESFSPVVIVSGPPMIIRSTEDVPRALGLLESDNEQERIWAGLVLANGARVRMIDIKIAVKALANALSYDSRSVRINAASALVSAVEMGTDISEAVDSLEAGLYDEKRVRSNSAIALALHWELTHDQKILAKLIGHHDPEIKRYGERLSEFRTIKSINEGPYR